MSPVTRLVCSGCGWEPDPLDPAPFACGNARRLDDVDHVVRRELSGAALAVDDDPNPFVRWRSFWHATHTAFAGGLDDAAVVKILRDLDDAVSRVDGRGFRITPFARDATLGVWVKDETGNVSGSHKGRHLVGVLFWLRVMECLGRGVNAPLAIASCGNAALAAAVVARAAGRPLTVFVPPHADPRVLESLTRHGARIESCPRVSGESGDPCVLRFREAVARGALPFSVQGNLNGLSEEGGETLALEMAPAALTDVVVQVGGGALASAVSRGFRNASDLGQGPRPPRLHTVQTEGAWPLFRAWRAVATRLVSDGGGPPVPERPGAAEALAVASWIAAHVPSERVAEEMTWARRHRSRVMWPWETEPRSVAGGILDDETYDWGDVVEGMLRTGGAPLVASEAELAAARNRAREAGYRVDATGSAGLAGVPLLAAAGAFGPESRVAVLFTGVER